MKNTHKTQVEIEFETWDYEDPTIEQIEWKIKWAIDFLQLKNCKI